MGAPGAPWLAGPIASTRPPLENSVMTIEMLYLTEQVRRWLNAQVADHLAAQAERLMTARQIAPRTFGTDQSESIATVQGAETDGIAHAMPWDTPAASRCPATQMGMLDSAKEAARP